MDLFHVPIIYLKECIDPRGGEGGGAVHAELRDTEEIGVFQRDAIGLGQAQNAVIYQESKIENQGAEAVQEIWVRHRLKFSGVQQ